MRLKIEIDDQLMSLAMAAGYFKPQKEAIKEGLRRITRTRACKKIRALRGQLQWSQDVDWTNEPHEIT